MGLSHRICKTSCKDHSIGFRAIVVFSSGDISTGTIKVHVHGVVQILASNEASDAWEVRAGNSAKVITLRMASVIAKYGDGLILFPKAQQCHYRIDDTLGFGSNRWIFGRTGSRCANFAISASDPTLASNLFDDRFTDAIVGKCHCVWNGCLNCCSGFLNDFPVEIAVESRVALDL